MTMAVGSGDNGSRSGDDGSRVGRRRARPHADGSHPQYIKVGSLVWDSRSD